MIYEVRSLQTAPSRGHKLISGNGPAAAMLRQH